jgi:hypothetical protein
MLKKIKGLLKEAKVTSDMRKNYPKNPSCMVLFIHRFCRLLNQIATIEEIPQKLSVRNS